MDRKIKVTLTERWFSKDQAFVCEFKSITNKWLNVLYDNDILKVRMTHIKKIEFLD